jgi:serine/threonine protein kinase/tetratricopeptide (TPR) repeat protein
MNNGAAELKDAKTIFGRAAEIDSPAERAVYLDQACAGGAELRAEVDRLLSAADAAGNFMGGPAAELPRTAAMSPMAEVPGNVIGPYKLMEQIGEGGFGLVFVAEQQRPVRRKVALKIIKPGMDSRDVIARFEAERQALALMDHPNIAKVFDAGVVGPASRGGPDGTAPDAEKGPARLAGPTGRPYFVMELVRGIPITDYCDQHLLTPRDRLQLFVSVCHAIQHAHQKGIIHRDVKPTNVLVTLHDGVPVVKVIDFGVAKALSQQLTERTIYTQFAQMLGTPLYMSPEQAEMSGLDIDTRSDIYSLGVLLYELLTGTTPFDRERFKQAAALEIRRILTEEEPPKPSTRLSQLSRSGASSRTSAQGCARHAEPTDLATLAAQRNTEPAKLTKLIRGDLDWIVMKCLEQDRTRRYETANDVARDVERYLHDEPVQACPPSAVYRFLKFARRYRKTLVAATFIFAALICGITVATWQAVRATRAEREALAERDAKEIARRQAIERQSEAEQARFEEAQAREQAEAVTEFLVRAFESPHPLRDGQTVTVAEVLDRAELQVEKELADQPLTQAALLDAIGRSRAGLGHSTKAINALARAHKLRQEALGENHRDTLTSLNGLASAYRAAGQREKAIELYEKTLAARRATLGDHHPDTLASLRALANIYHAVGRRTEALHLYQQSMVVADDNAKKTTSDAPKEPVVLTNPSRDQLASQHVDDKVKLQEQLLQHGFFAASTGLASRVSAEAINNLMDTVSRFHGEETPGALDAVVLGELRLIAGELDSAEAAIRLAIAHGETRPFVYKSLGWCLLAQGRNDEATKAFKQALIGRMREDGTFDLAGADADEMTAAYFLDLVPEKQYVAHTAGSERLAGFPWFYVGQRREIGGDQQGAMAAYQQCVALGRDETAHSVRALARWRLMKLSEGKASAVQIRESDESANHSPPPRD